MKAHVLSALILGALLVGGPAEAKDWETDYAKAVEQAQEEGKFLLLDFSGSDWCGWCIKLEDEVFSEREFKSFAEENLVCVLLDFPRRKKLSKEETAQNAELAKKHKISGYPTVLLLTPDEKLVTRTGYRKGGPEAYVGFLESEIAPYRKDLAPQVGGSASRTSREWTTLKGSIIQATLKTQNEGWVELETDDGRQVKIHSFKLSEADRAYLRDALKDGPLSQHNGGRTSRSVSVWTDREVRPPLSTYKHAQPRAPTRQAEWPLLRRTSPA